jgi:hypothetical protein
MCPEPVSDNGVKCTPTDTSIKLTGIKPVDNLTLQGCTARLSPLDRDIRAGLLRDSILPETGDRSENLKRLIFELAKRVEMATGEKGWNGESLYDGRKASALTLIETGSIGSNVVVPAEVSNDAAKKASAEVEKASRDIEQLNALAAKYVDAAYMLAPQMSVEKLRNSIFEKNR